MLKITKKEFEAMRKSLYETNIPVQLQAILDLEVGEAIYISRSEWPYISKPSQVFRWHDMKSRKFTTTTHPEGYAVLRIK